MFELRNVYSTDVDDMIMKTNKDFDAKFLFSYVNDLIRCPRRCHTEFDDI